MPNTSFKIPLKHIHLLDELVNEGKYKSRGEVIRESLLYLLNDIFFETEN